MREKQPSEQRDSLASERQSFSGEMAAEAEATLVRRAKVFWLGSKCLKRDHFIPDKCKAIILDTVRPRLPIHFPLKQQTVGSSFRQYYLDCQYNCSRFIK